MEAVFLRILSFILSLLLAVFNTVSSVFPGIMPDEPIENNVYVYDAEDFYIYENTVIPDYVSWYLAGGKNLKDYDWKYFFTKSVVLVPFTLPDPGYTIENIAVSEKGDTLDISFKYVSGDGEYAAVECPKVIVVETSKNIKFVEVTSEKETDNPDNPNEPDVPDIPEIPDEPPVVNNYGIYSADNFTDDYIHDRSQEIINSYDEWYYYYDGGETGLIKYNREYFKTKSLAVFYISVPQNGKTIQINNISEDESYLRVRYRVKNGEDKYAGGMWAVVIETSKDIDYVILTQIGMTEGYALIDAEMFNEGAMPLKQDGAYKIVSTYQKFAATQGEDYFTEIYYNNEFFEDSSLALIYIMLPNYNYDDIVVNSMVENGNVLEIEYSTEEFMTRQDYENVKYLVMFAEISKNITEVKATDTRQKNRYGTFDYFKLEGTEEGLVVTDYESWTRVASTSYAPLAKYDEEYFETRSVVLISKMTPDSGAFFDVIKVKENGDTLDITYLIDSFGGLQALTYKTLLIEVSKNIKNVSAVQRYNREIYKAYPSACFNLSSSEQNSAVLISDYNTWLGYPKSSSTEFKKYNINYFETKSVVLLNISLPGGEYKEDVRYLYTEGNTLYAGTELHNFYKVGGFTAMIYKTVVVEVDKDITQVDYEIMR
ncbi:MAG: hypothetical protein E7516_05495 [Ruminococcaceae bacterium]|nr:hypothetical protein [Oscillospiraceae bacterium]